METPRILICRCHLAHTGSLNECSKFTSGNLYYARQFERDCESETDLKFEVRSKSTFSRDPVQSRSTFSHDPVLTAHLIYRSRSNYVSGKCGF